MDSRGNNASGEMKRELKNRHLQMIALGGGIGTGLFYGSTGAIMLAGPSVILAYIIGGTVIFLIMRMLGEMAVEEPVSGSFSYYAGKYWGSFPGFLSGWNYWANYILVSMAELIAVGIYVSYWLPGIPHWVSALVALVVITTLNLINVRAYGESEFWLALIKIVAIILMIVLGFYLILESPLSFPDNFQNLWVNGGFFPYGPHGLMLSLAVILFSFGGIELIGITAGEAENPTHTIPRAINQVIWRILVFYVGTMFVLMTLWPWNEVGVQASPFVQIFANVGIPAAAHILNGVVLMAALSVYNSAIYSNSRMLYGLARSGEAPHALTHLSESGVPVRGILVSSGITLLCVIMNIFFPQKVFFFLMSIATCAAIISWTVICITHLKFRARCRREGKKTRFRALFSPVSNYICLFFLGDVLYHMAQIPNMSLSVYILPFWILVLYIAYRVKKRKEKNA